MQYLANLPQPVAQALQELGGYEYSTAAAPIPPALLPKSPYKLGQLIDCINNFYNSPLIEVSGITFDIGAKTAKLGSTRIYLTEKEAEIINLLYNSKTSVTKENMLRQIWQYSDDASTNTTETHIYRLRQKLAESFGSPVIDTNGSSYSIKK